MSYRGALLGLIMALMLLTGGLLLLPEPDWQSLAGLFVTLWLALTFLSALGFSISLWKKEKLQQARKEWRRGGARTYRRAGQEIPETGELIRQRERRIH